MDDESAPSVPDDTYARRVGQRLRAIRRQKGLSLQEVESASSHEFKASVLGAYERGERIISVPRLQRLAGYYDVPVDQLLPAANDTERGAGRGDGDGPDAAGGDRSGRAAAGPQKVTFDLARFRDIEDPELDMVRQYLNQIQVMRQDFNGRVLTIRGDDIRAIAGLFGTDTTALIERLDALSLRYTS